MTFPRLGAIFDRAVHLLVRNAVPFAVCMSPAIVLSILASAADPGSLSAEEVIGANGDVSSYERAYWLFSGALIVATFAQWVCAAAVMIGVRWLLRGYPPSPLTWMLVGIARTPALLLTFLLPTLPMVVPLILIGTTAYRLSQAIANDPDSLDFQIGLLRYESLGVVVLGVIAVPLAGVASAVVVLDGLRPVRAVVVAMRTCFSRTQFKRFLALSAAIVALFAAEVPIFALGKLALQQYQTLVIVWPAVRAVVDAAIAAYGATIVALAWLIGYIGPKRLDDLSA